MIKILGISTAVLAVLLTLLGLQYRNLSDRYDTAIESLQTANATIETMKEGIAITEETSNELEAANAKLANDLNRLRKRPARCVPIAPRPSGERDEGSQPRKHVRANGISDQWLYEYAAEAEGYRLQVIACQKFVNRTWTTYNQ